MRRRLVIFVTLAALAAAATFAAVSGASFTTASSTAVRAATAPLSGDALRAYAGSGQTATAGAAVAIAPSVKITDAGGNPVSGVSIGFAVASGGGSVTSGSAVTDSSGVAAAGTWTLGATAGVNKLTATASGIAGSVTFTAIGTAGVATTIAIDAGDGQSATVGATVAIAPSVKVTDANGNPVSGVTVTFAASGDGSAAGTAQTTSASGAATVGSWTLGTVAGIDTLTATVSGLTPATFTATGKAGAATLVGISGGDGQSATVNAAVAFDPSVKVTDQYGNPVSGVIVVFAAATGGGSVTGATQTTNASGIATVGIWTLGTKSGTNTLTATVGSITQVTFTASGTAGAAVKIVVTPGTSTPPAGSAVTMTAQISDSYGNAVGIQKTITWTRTAGTLSSSSTTTNSSTGATSVTFTPSSTTAGTQNTVTAANVAYSSGSATVTVVATAAITMAINAGGTTQTATVGTAVATDPSVRITDAYGNAVSGATVTFAVASGGGSVTGATQTTDATGVATVTAWALGTTAGSNTLTATSGSLSKTFAATGSAAAAAKLVVSASDSTPAAGSSVTMSAQLADQYGNAVRTSGLTIIWVKTAGTLGTPTTTSSNGISTVTFTPSSTTAGTLNTVTASRGGLASASVDLTVVAAAASRMVVFAGNSQNAVAGTAVSNDPTVKVTDAYGNPTSGVSVTFTPTSGSGSVTGGVQTTGSDGVAAVTTWTLGTNTGTDTLTASSSGLTSVSFTATATPGTAASIQVTTPDKTPKKNTTFTVSAQLLDAYGNKVTTSGVTVTFTRSGSTSITFQTTTTPVTDGTGLATVNMRASSSGLSCTVTATVGSISGSLAIGATTN